MKMMSNLLISLVLLAMLSATTGCGNLEKPTPKPFTFSSVIANQAMHANSNYCIFTQGVVVYKALKNNTEVAVVAGLPLKMVNPNQLLDKDVMAIKLPGGTYDSLPIGSIVSAVGSVSSVTNEGKTHYYVNAESVQVTGLVDVADPDFTAISNAITQNSGDDGFSDLFVGWLFFELITGGPTGIFDMDDD